jgi:pimeloyl-ACP methyl ester carboxylesterase
LSTANSYFIGGTSGFGTKRVTKVGDVWTIQQLLSGGNSALININQANPEIVFADAGGQYFRSDNYGNTWIQLGLDHPGGVGNIIDGSTVYVGRYDVAEGVYRSTNNGITWVFKNNGLSGKIYSLKYNKKLSYIFASRAHNQGGGIWLSKNSGDSWENVSSTTWANINVWGVEVTDKYVFASVQGLGIYRAELPTNAVSPSPIIFLPGFGGSWSYKGLVENQPTTSADWSLLPFADSYYNPLIQTLKNAGVNPYIFAYDYRKSITDTAVVLNSYIDTVQTANPGQKVNIITHSMGSLVARQCFEKVSGCAAKIDKIITAGGPHQGTLAAYPLWEAGEIDGFNLWTRSAIDLALRATNLPFLTSKDIIQNRFPGVRDLIPPTFVSNPNLQSLTPASSNFSPVVNPLSGNSVPTKSGFTTTTRSVLDVALGLWVDGKPASYSFSPGDGTIAKTSSEILSSTNNKYYDVEHSQYFQNPTAMSDILNIFSLPPTPLATSTTSPLTFLAFVLHSPATMVVKGNNGDFVGTNDGGKTVFISNPTSQNYQIILTGTGNGPVQLDSFYTNSAGTTKKTFNTTVTTGSVQTITYSAYDFNATLASFRAKVAATSNRGLGTIEAMVVTSVGNIQANRNRNSAFLNLESAHQNIWRLVVFESDGASRQNLIECANQLQSLAVSLNRQYRTEPSGTTVTAEIARAQKAIDARSAKSSLTFREAANLDQAKKQLATASTQFSTNQNYTAILSSRPCSVLAN